MLMGDGLSWKTRRGSACQGEAIKGCTDEILLQLFRSPITMSTVIKHSTSKYGLGG